MVNLVAGRQRLRRDAAKFESKNRLGDSKGRVWVCSEMNRRMLHILPQTTGSGPVLNSILLKRSHLCSMKGVAV